MSMTACPAPSGLPGSPAPFVAVFGVVGFLVIGLPNDDPDEDAPPPNADSVGACPLPNAEVGFGVGFDSAKKSALSKLFIQV
jgi:hypothetical protein